MNNCGHISINPIEYTHPVKVDNTQEYHDACLSMISDRIVSPSTKGARILPITKVAFLSASADTDARSVVELSMHVTSLLLLLAISFEVSLDVVLADSLVVPPPLSTLSSDEKSWSHEIDSHNPVRLIRMRKALVIYKTHHDIK